MRHSPTQRVIHGLRDRRSSRNFSGPRDIRQILRPEFIATVLGGVLLIASPGRATEVGQQLPREGDEIMVCGQLFHTTAPVVLWTDPGGYDAYRVERRFSDWKDASWEASKRDVPSLDTPNRYGVRESLLTPEELARVRGGGWDLPLLQKTVDQFVMHYDVCGFSQTCFKVLHDNRGLSVHFMLDIDGTIFQTLDLKERAWHATISNARSIGVEIAQIGAYPNGDDSTLAKWYSVDEQGRVSLKPPRTTSSMAVRTQPFRGRPDRPELIVGTIQGTKLQQYDFTPQQYESLIKLTATLCRVFPKLKCEYPRDANGALIDHVLDSDEWNKFQGVLGHYHVQKNKTDPGPAFNWDKVIDGAQQLLDAAK
ncbi:MAG: N-acetylmuramoyl-L-alanine amidase [Planctomycetales bacterium]|nr:N-acetylmuramoyl-L-alanine amidase [Planctomycetales bacterium]